MALKSTTSIAAVLAGLLFFTACEMTDADAVDPAPAETVASEGAVEEVVVTGSLPEADGTPVRSEPMPAPPPPPPPPSVVRAPSPVTADRRMMSEAPSSEGGFAKSAPPPGVSLPTPIPAPVPAPPKPQPPAQSGLLTAGDYDDLLNASLFRDYASEFLQEQGGKLELPDIDVTEAITIKVTGRNGVPIRGANVSLSAGNQFMFDLQTSSAGTVRLFPQFDALPKNLVVNVSGQGSDIKTLSYEDITNRKTAGPVSVTLNEGNTAATAFDLMLVIDTTGSMGDELRYLQEELKDIVSSVESSHPNLDIRIGLTLYRDVGDEYVVREFDFTSNIDELQANLAAQKANGGGNYPEAMDQAMVTAMKQSWREDSIKALMLVADAPPRDENIAATWDQAILARPKGVHIVPVAASGVGPKAEYIMRAMAAVTQSRYIFLTDDSGIGNPHAEPDVDCYVVTRLDTMVKRVLSSLITGTRQEPSDAEIIRTVGNYNGGVCELDQEGQERIVQTSGGN